MDLPELLSEPPSCLSQNIIQILCESGKVIETDMSSPSSVASCLNKDGLLEWELLALHLPESQETAEYYKHCVSILFPLLHQIHCFYKKLKREEFSLMYDKYLAWISQKKIVPRCFELLQHGDSTAANHTVLLLTPLIERGLGDLILLKMRQCPSLLRDLLLLNELNELLQPVAVQFLRLLIGPPISLNLRNVSWHGFPSPNEIHPRYSYTLLCVMLSIGSLLHSSGIMDTLQCRQEFFDVEMPCIFPELHSSNLDHIRHIFCDSQLVLSSMKQFWLLALQLFVEERYGECIVILMPQFEHALRRIYVTVNNCPERIMTAENDVLFTTIDKILNKFLNNGDENQLRNFVGDSYLSLLLDFLVYPLGPRVRDHISHGEVILDDVPFVTVQHLLCLCYHLAARYLPENHQLLKNDFYNSVQHTVDKYQSLFHPISITKQKVLALAQTLSGWSAFPRPDASFFETHDISAHHCSVQSVLNQLKLEEQSSISAQTCRTLDAAVAFERFICAEESLCYVSHNLMDYKRILEPFHDCVGIIREKLQPLSPMTVYRCQPSSSSQVDEAIPLEREEEILGILSKTVTILLSTSSQIHEVLSARYDQWKNRELRSRQRKTYAKMLDGTNVLLEVLRLILCIALLTFCHLDSLHQKKSAILIRFLKKVQKFSENLLIQTNISSNKWDEALVQTWHLIELTNLLEFKH